MAELPQTVFVVQIRHWEFNDNWFDPIDDRETIRAFRSRENAQACCDLLNEEDRKDDDYWGRAFRHRSDEPSELSDLTGERLAERMMSVVGHLPKGDHDWYDWCDWWAELPESTKQVASKLLAPMDNFCVVEIPTDGLATEGG